MQETFVRKLETYRPLTPKESEVLRRARSSERRVTSGTDIVSEGASPTFSSIIVDGFACRYNLLAEGRRQITAIHIPGDFCDVHSFLLRRMDDSVAALSDCTIACVPHETLREILEVQPGLTHLLWISTAVDAALHRHWSVRLARHSAKASIAHFLCELFVRLKMVGMTQANGFAAPITQTELADVTGLGRSHVNLSLQELRVARLLNWEHRHIEIVEWDGLCALGEFDPTYLNLSPEQARQMNLGGDA